MYRASNAFRTEVAKNGRTFETRILVDGQLNEDIHVKGYTYTGGVIGESRIDIGAAVCATMNLELYAPNIYLAGRELEIQIRPKAETPVEWISLGLFTCDRPSHDGEAMQIMAYDRMLKLDRPFASALAYPADSNSILQEISTTTGVPVTLPSRSVSVSSEPTEYSCRETVSYIAQLLGCFASIDRTGTLVFKWYQSYGEVVPYGRYWAPFTKEEADYELGKIECVIGEEVGTDGHSQEITVSAGSGVNTIRFANPYMTQAALDLVYQSISGLRFRPGQVTAMGDPQIDPGDLVTVYDGATPYTLAASSLIFEFDGGLSMTIRSTGNGEGSSGLDTRGPTAKIMDRIRAEMVIANDVIAKKANIDDLQAANALITNLQAQNAVFENTRTDYLAFREAAGASITAAQADISQIRTVDLTAVNARIDNLISTDISAVNANIETLNAGYANIKTLLAGNAAATMADMIQLNANNAVIDSAMLRSALINVLSVNDLVAGRISTDRFVIGSDDGATSLSGNLLQMKDGDGNVRIQMGKDALGNFTFVLMGADGEGQLLDQDGLKAAAISDGLIVDSMVADSGGSYQGISASKLNISSVIGSLNSVGGIKSSSIWFDEEGQSLRQLYTAMSQTVQGAVSSASQAVTAAKASEDIASAALSALEGISTLDAFTLFLSNDAHVVHTENDGSGGNYSEAFCVVTALMGDTDVSSHATFVPVPSPGISGTWNQDLRKYQVTAMDGMDGYVDFQVSYGMRTRYLQMPDDKRLLMPDGKVLVVRAGIASLTKRFSLSKSPDGRTGISYSVIANPIVIRKDQDGTLSPGHVEFRASLNDDGRITDYDGYFTIEESTNGTAYTEKYSSESAEHIHLYTPSSSSVKSIRCTLADEDGTTLDVQNALIITDADGIYDAIDGLDDRLDTVEEQTQITTSKMTEYEQSMEAFRVSFSETTEELLAATDGFIQWEPIEDIDWEAGIDHIRARVVSKGRDITTDYPSEWFTYWRKNEDGLVQIGSGYTIDVAIEDVGYSGEIQMVFTTYDSGYVVFPDGRHFLMPGGEMVLFDFNEV